MVCRHHCSCCQRLLLFDPLCRWRPGKLRRPKELAKGIWRTMPSWWPSLWDWIYSRGQLGKLWYVVWRSGDRVCQWHLFNSLPGRRQRVQRPGITSQKLQHMPDGIISRWPDRVWQSSGRGLLVPRTGAGAIWDSVYCATQ